VGGVPETVEQGSTALLVDPGNPKALAQNILQILGDPALGESLRSRGLASARERSPESHYRALSSIYESVLKEG